MRRYLADLVQALRMLMWRSSGRLHAAVGEEAWRLLADLDWRRPSSLLRVAERLRSSVPELAEEWAALADDLAAVPRPHMPDDGELLRRYVDGEIGDRTVQWLRGWDAFQLADECLKRGLPPCQVTETAAAALSILDRGPDVPPDSGTRSREIAMSDLERKLARMRLSRERMDALIEAFRAKQEGTVDEALGLVAQGIAARRALDCGDIESYSVEEFRRALTVRTGDRP